MLTKLKLYGAAVLAFFLAMVSAKHYRGKAKRLEKQVIKEKAKAHNLQAQAKAALRDQEKHRKELADAVKDGSYIDYFDDDGSMQHNAGSDSDRGADTAEELQRNGNETRNHAMPSGSEKNRV